MKIGNWVLKCLNVCMHVFTPLIESENSTCDLGLEVLLLFVRKAIAYNKSTYSHISNLKVGTTGLH